MNITSFSSITGGVWGARVQSDERVPYIKPPVLKADDARRKKRDLSRHLKNNSLVKYPDDKSETLNFEMRSTSVWSLILRA